MDPIADFLTRVRNGLQARRKEVSIAHTRMKFELSRILLEEGYISNFRVEGEGRERRIVVTLKYLDDGTSVIRGLEMVSRRSRRVYVGAPQIPKVLGGLGTAVMSTPKGIITDRDARQKRVGGEVMFRVW